MWISHLFYTYVETLVCTCDSRMLNTLTDRYIRFYNILAHKNV